MEDQPSTITNELLFEDVYFNTLRQTEFKRLDTNRQVYLDYTGGNIYAESLLLKHFEFLKQSVCGNPHSSNPSSHLSTTLIEQARQRVLNFFNAEEYYCIFTGNTSEALRIVGESYPFSEDSLFLYTIDNHNSVNGIREHCHNKKGKHKHVPVNFNDLCLDETILDKNLRAYPEATNKLFAYPAQSNASGIKHDLSWVAKAKELGWDVLLDVAAFVPTNPLDLRKIQPDFLAVSFYKIFGYPTGIGCLLVHKSKFKKLEKHWFAGGTVSMVSISYPNYFLIGGHEKFENGTLNYLNLPALSMGFDFIDQIGMVRIQKRVAALIGFLIKEMSALQHDNGQNLCHIFGSKNLKHRGSNLIFSLLDKNGKSINLLHLEQQAGEANISLRTGCFCNPGIDEVNFKVSEEDMAEYFCTRSEGDYNDLTNFIGFFRGNTRVSVGIATTKSDLDYFINFLRRFLNAAV